MNENVGSNVVLENESVRVWDDRVAPGATQHLHTHRKPYLAVVIEGATAETLNAEGQVTRTFQFTPGETYFFGPDALPVTHALKNTGETEISVVIVELL